jgi:hypothetical protein
LGAIDFDNIIIRTNPIGCINIGKQVAQKRMGRNKPAEQGIFPGFLFPQQFQGTANPIPAGNVHAALAPAEYPGNGAQVVQGRLVIACAGLEPILLVSMASMGVAVRKTG